MQSLWLGLLVFAATLLPAPPAHASWDMKDFLILYTNGWPADQVAGRMSEQSLGRIAAAHYNTVMCATTELELVARAGLRCLVIGWSQGPPDWIGEAVPPAVARGLASNPAVWGYYVMDEPDNINWKRGALFRQLGERVNEYRMADPDHVPWINLMTSNDRRYLEDYMRVVKPDLLSFDVYRWWVLEVTWWRCLEAHRAAALQAGVPLIVWIESNTSERRFMAHLPPPEDNATKLRWSVYTSLAYGSKGVQWFLGTMSEDVAILNAELSVLGPTLVKLESRHVFHTSDVPREGQRLPGTSWYSTDSPKLLIGELARRDEPNATYLLVVNKSIDAEADPVIEFRGRTVSAVEEVNRNSVGRTALSMERQAGATRIRLPLAAGDGRLVRIESPR